MQPAQLLVHVDQAGGDAGKAAVALIGGVGDVDRIGYGLEKALKSGFGLALFGQLVERLFGLDDLFAGFGGHVDLGRLGGDVATQFDQLAADRQIIDHLGIVACGKGRDRSPGETGEIGGAAQFLEAFVVFHERP